MGMTKAEWAQVEERLRYMHHPVALMCDGYHVIFVVQPHKELINKIHVFVNGKMRFSDKNNPEEVTRFSFPSQRYAYSAKQRAEMKKEPKWLRKKFGLDPEEKYTVYLPWWGSFKALKAHLVKNSADIELLKDWRYEVKAKAEA